VWTLADGRSVYVVEHSEGRGQLRGNDLRRRSRCASGRLAARGLEPDERQTYSDGVRKMLYRDADGNELGFGGAPLDAVS
jgi:hypothetical protein